MPDGAPAQRPVEQTRRVHDLPMRSREAPVAPDTVDADARTVEVVWTTGAEVVRRWWDGEVRYRERLSVDPAHVDLGRLNAGAPVLNTHGRYDLSQIIGVVERAWIANGEGRAILRFSDREDVEPYWRDIQAGIIRNVSVGYQVRRYEVIEEEGQVEVRTAVDWEPAEISMVPIPADTGAGTRAAGGADQTHPCEIIDRRPGATHHEERDMDPKDIQPGTDGHGTEPTAQTRTAETSETRAAPGGATSQRPEAPARHQARPTGQDDPVLAERARIAGIYRAAETLGLERSVADGLVTDGVTLDQARAAMIDRLADQPGQPATRGVVVQAGDESGDDPAVMVRRMTDALAARHTGAEVPEASREYVGLSVADLARDLLAARGERVGRRERTPEIITRAMTTSDLPILLQDTGNRMLMAAYEMAPTTYRQIAREMSAPDFRAKTLVRDGDFPDFAELNEHGELQQGSLSESSESLTLTTVGRRLRLTRQALINDDLGSFADLARKAGQAAARYENKKVWGVVTNNTALSDGVALFHTASHKNLASSAAAISATAVGKGKEAIRTQTSIDGNTLNYTPRLLIVPAALETTAEQYLSDTLVPGTSANVVPGSHRSLGLVVEPLLDAASATAWYLMVDPAALATIVFAYLEGAPGPQLRQRDTADPMGIEYDTWLDFAAAPVDHRGAYKNAGT
jgi:phage major head subunit gpT-like protein